MRLDVLKAEASVDQTKAPEAHYISHLRLRLMERAYYVLRLNHYMNAEDNFGWMSLFRMWHRSEDFTADYEALKHTLSPQFRAFYDKFVAKSAYTTEARALHPWLDEDDDAASFMDTGRTPTGPRPGAGGVDDAKGHRGVDQGYEGGSDKQGGDSGPPPVPNA